MNPEEMFKRLGIRTADSEHHHSRPDWINWDCPHCSPQSDRFRMGYNVSGKYANCWLCGRKDLVSTLMRASGRDFTAVTALLGEVSGGREFASETSVKRTGTLVIPPGVGELLPAHRRYLKKRGFDPDEIESVWGVKGIGIAARLKWRLFIPAEYGGRIVSWTTRSVAAGSRVPYLSAPPDQEETSLKSLLYGEHLCGNSIAIQEGPLDAWAVGPGAVATCGVGYSRAQLKRMSRFPVRYVAFDNEPDAQARARKLCRELEMFDGDTYNVVWETGKDASRASEREVRKLRSLLR